MSGYLRGLDHWNLYENWSDESVLWQYSLDCQNGTYGPDGYTDYQMVTVRGFRDPMTRQVSEGTHIRRLEVADETDDAICLNSRLDRG